MTTKASLIDLNGNEMILDADGDTKIDAATDDEIHFTVAGSETVYMGVTSYNASDRIVLTNTSGNASMAIVAGTSGESSIFMADGTSGNASYRGYLQYQHANDNWNFGTAATLAMKIDSAGQVTKPSQPYMRCAGNSASMVTNQGTLTDPFNNWSVQASSGITHSSGVFTVPVAGKYLITYSFYNWINNSGKGVTHYAQLKKGSSTYQETSAEYDFEDDAYSYYDNNLNNSLILDMAAGDTFQFAVYADVYGGGLHTNMSAYLLG